MKRITLKTQKYSYLIVFLLSHCGGGTTGTTVFDPIIPKEIQVAGQIQSNDSQPFDMQVVTNKGTIFQTRTETDGSFTMKSDSTNLIIRAATPTEILAQSLALDSDTSLTYISADLRNNNSEKFEYKEIQFKLLSNCSSQSQDSIVLDKDCSIQIEAISTDVFSFPVSIQGSCPNSQIIQSVVSNSDSVNFEVGSFSCNSFQITIETGAKVNPIIQVDITE